MLPHFTAPEISLPMEEIIFEYPGPTTIPGGIQGEVDLWSYMVFHFVPGRIGNALLMSNGFYVDYGSQNDCFHRPERCASGVTFALWLWLNETQGGIPAIVFDSGASNTTRNGYALLLESDHSSLSYLVSTDTHHVGVSADVTLETWIHVVATWRVDQTAELYVDGCLAVTER